MYDIQREGVVAGPKLERLLNVDGEDDASRQANVPLDIAEKLFDENSVAMRYNRDGQHRRRAACAGCAWALEVFRPMYCATERGDRQMLLRRPYLSAS